MLININGLSVNYEVYGQGPRLLLLHGWADSLHTFSKVVTPLSQNFQVILIDLPGFGLSQSPKEVYGVFEYADFLENFLLTLDIKNTFILGHSMGGAIALAYASRYHRSEKLILEDSAGIHKKKFLTILKIRLFKILKYITLPVFREQLKSVVGSTDYKNAGSMRKVLVKITNEDLTSIMPRIAQSVLLIWGENDTTTPPTDAKIFESDLKNSKLVVLKNCDHFPHLEYPEEFVKLVTEFLK